MPDAHPIGSAPAPGRAAAANDQPVENQTSGVFDEAKKIGSDLLNAACDGVVGVLDEQRTRAAAHIAVIGDALRRSTATLGQDTGMPSLGYYADEAARRAEDLAGAVRSRSWSALADDLESVARDWPAVYIAAAAGLGFLAGRLLLSAAPKRHQARSEMQANGSPEWQGGVRQDYRAVGGPARAGDGAGWGNE